MSEYELPDSYSRYDKNTQFVIAAQNGYMISVRRLALDPEVDVDFVDSFGQSPFMYACRSGGATAVRFFLDYNKEGKVIDYNRQFPSGGTGFQAAFLWNQYRVIELLLEDPRIIVPLNDRRKFEPFHDLAYGICTANPLTMVKVLLSSSRDFDLSEENEVERTAEKIALECSRPIMAALFQNYRENPKKVRMELRIEKDFPNAQASGEVFALTVLLSDGYLALKS